MAEQIRTFCRVCEPSCGLVAHVENGELRKLTPDRDHPVTKGFACHKGLAGVAIHNDPDRLDHPLRRTDAGFERASWDDAIGEVAAKLRAIVDEDGPNAVATYLGNPLAFNSLASQGTGSFIAQLGTRKVFSSGTQDCANKFAGSEAVFGSSTIHPVPDIEHTDHLLVFGANPRISHMSFFSVADPMKVLKSARDRGATVRFINPRRIESESAGEVVLIRPDTDLYLMAAMLCEIDRAGLMDESALREHGENVAGLLEFVRLCPADRAAPITGISAARIRELALEFARAPSAAVHMSTGVNMGRQGTLAYWLLHMLSFTTGNLDRRGGNLYSLGFYPAAKAGRIAPDRVRYEDTRWGRLRRSRGALPGNLLADMILDPEPGKPIRALVVAAGNPLLSIGGEEKLRRAFESLELIVCVDLYRNATGELAHYLLPATDMFERPDINLCGLGLQHQPFVQYSDRVVEARGERREEWWIFGRLEQALGFKSVLDAGDAPPVFGRLDHMLGASGLSIEGLRASEDGTAVLPDLEPGRFYSDWLQTEHGRVECCPPLFEAALERSEEICRELEAESPGQLKLISRRDNSMHNSWYQNVPGLKRGKQKRNVLYIHPDDAKTRDVLSGDSVRVSNQWGEIELPVEFDETLMPGVVAAVHGWGNARTSGMRVAQSHPGTNCNRLLPSGPGSFEPLSNQAFMTGVPVEVCGAG